MNLNSASINLLEQHVTQRLLAVAEVIADKYGLPVPTTLQIAEGDRLTRSLVRLGDVAEFLEMLLFESIQKGLGGKLKVYGMNTVAEVRSATIEDLMVVEGVGEKTALEIKRLVELTAKPVPPFLDDNPTPVDIPTFDELSADLPEDWLGEIIGDEDDDKRPAG